MSANNDDIELTRLKKGVSKSEKSLILFENSRTIGSLDFKVVNNSNSPENCIDGKIVVYRKSKGEQYSSEVITRSSLKEGERYEISMTTEELYNFYKALGTLYNSFSNKEAGAIGTYVQFDDTPESIKRFLNTYPFQALSRDDPLIRNQIIDIFSEIICTHPITEGLLIELISKLNNLNNDSMGRLLQILSDSDRSKLIEQLVDKDVETIQSTINLAELKHVKAIIEKHLDCGDEIKWQVFFEKHKWVLPLLFPVPVDIFLREPYVGGKTLENKDGKCSDFSVRNGITGELSLIEIKTPLTALVGRLYRNNTYGVSSDLTGAVSQISRNMWELTKNIDGYISNAFRKSDSVRFDYYGSKGVVLAGTMQSLNDSSDKQISFSMFRNQLSDIIIVTYDELLQKIDNLITIMSNKNNT